MEVLAVRGGWDGAGLAGAGGVVGDEVCWESGCEGVGVGRVRKVGSRGG